MTTDTTTADAATLEEQVGAYAERLFGTGLAALEATTISLGRELGLYAQLTDAAGTAPAELAARAGVHPRYAREWLEQQASAGFVDVVAAAEDGETRRYALSAAGQECLLRPESLASVGPLLDLLPALARVFPGRLVDAYRSGGGIPYADYAVHDAQGDFNRPAFVHSLASEWVPAVPGLAQRLAAGPARIAEIGCGEGWAAVALARAWPQVVVDAFDSDEASVAAARKHAADSGVGERVHIEVVDVTQPLPDRVTRGGRDLVLAVEMIHDLAHPVAALRAMRELGGPDAAYLVVDERAGEAFEAPTENPVERLLYASSVLHCLPVGMVAADSVATGTVMRPSTFRAYAHEAGFSAVEELPVANDFFRFYHLTA